MKRTVSVNLKGMNFLIEEDAYELLQNYMDRLNHVLRNESGRKEIVEDIELRVAELCSSKLTEKKQVIEIEDLESILATLGDPSQYIDDESETKTSEYQTYSNNQQNSDKRLFRDLDNAMIAGVCSGIASFFNVHLIIIRAIFVVLFFSGGFGIPIYIILWIVVPRANSTIDRLRMKGQAITVESVRDEVEQAAGRIKSNSKSLTSKMRMEDSYSRHISKVGRFFSIAFGLFFFMLGLFFLTMFLIFWIGGVQFIPVQSDTGFLSFAEFGDLILTNSSDYALMQFGVIILSSSIILFLLLLGSKLLFKISNKWSNLVN